MRAWRSLILSLLHTPEGTPTYVLTAASPSGGIIDSSKMTGDVGYGVYNGMRGFSCSPLGQWGHATAPLDDPITPLDRPPLSFFATSLKTATFGGSSVA